jgi:hypothetical protein
MNRKTTLIAVTGGIAALFLIYLSVAGFPPAGTSLVGTIGEKNIDGVERAERYRAGQMSPEDIIAGNESIQNLIQNDVFQRLVASGEAEKIFGNLFRNEELLVLMASGENIFETMGSGENIVDFMASHNFESMGFESGLLEMMNSQDFRTLMNNEDFVALMNDRDLLDLMGMYPWEWFGSEGVLEKMGSGCGNWGAPEGYC